MISKAHTSAQKPCGRQLNAKVSGSESAKILSSSSLFRPQLLGVRSAVHFIQIQEVHIELHSSV